MTNNDLINSNIDTKFSGSTVVSLIILNKSIISANVGDSRAIISRNKNQIWTTKALSRDHKPDEPSEKLRVLENGGRVHPFNGVKI